MYMMLFKLCFSKPCREGNLPNSLLKTAQLNTKNPVGQNYPVSLLLRRFLKKVASCFFKEKTGRAAVSFNHSSIHKK